MNKSFQYFVLSLILILVVGAGSLGLYVVLKGAQAERGVKQTILPSALITYQKDNTIILFNTDSGESKRIGYGERPIFSHDKKFISYVVPGPANEYGNKEIGVYIYDLSQEKETMFLSKQEFLSALGIESIWQDQYPFTFAAWSPEDTILLIDSGTSAVRAEAAFEVTSGKPLFRFTALGRPQWIANDKLEFTIVDTNQNRPNETSGGAAIAQIGVGQTENILIPSDATTDYYLIDSAHNGKPVIEKTQVTKPEDWGSTTNDFQTSYYIYENGVLTPIEQPNSLDDQLNAIVENSFSTNTQIAFGDTLTSDASWVAFVASIFSEESPSIDTVYVINLSKPETLTKIDRGMYPNW